MVTLWPKPIKLGGITETKPIQTTTASHSKLPIKVKKMASYSTLYSKDESTTDKPLKVAFANASASPLGERETHEKRRYRQRQERFAGYLSRYHRSLSFACNER